jgi:hypothetical protein
VFQLEGESLVRPPRGYDKDHPLIADLRRKDFIAVCHLTQKKVLSPNFLEDYMAICAGASGFMHFLANAMELPYQDSNKLWTIWRVENPILKGCSIFCVFLHKTKLAENSASISQ